MINLIPNEEKKKMVRDFYFRLTIVFLIALAVSIFIAAVALLPAYFLSTAKEKVADTKLSAQSSEPVPSVDLETVSAVDVLNQKLALSEGLQNKSFLVSQKVISQIILKKMGDIKITQITYDAEPGKPKKVGVRGVAPSRERLLLFRKALEDDTAFQSVDLPISNFIRGSNIQFFLNLTPS